MAEAWNVNCCVHRSMASQIRHTARSLLRTRSFTVAALLCLALGIGATTAIFSIVNAVVLRPLPYKGSHDLVRIYTEFPGFPGGGLHKFWVSEPEVFDLQTACSFESMGAWTIVGANLSGDERPIRVTTAYVSSQILPMLRVAPELGQWIPPDSDKPGALQTVVISEALWKSHFAGDRGVIGKQTYLNGAKCTVVGVMPNGFVFPPGESDQPQVWAALQLDPKSASRSSHNYSVLGRLRPGVTLDQARQEMARLIAHWGEADSPKNHVFNPKNHPVSMYGFYDEIVGGVRPAMFMLIGAVVFVLLISCVNVANLLLARSEARQREIAVRRAIGASNGQLVKLFVTEGLLLSFLGAVLGLGLAYGGLRLILLTNAGNIPRADEINVDWRVLTFTLAVSCVTGVLFGVAPLVHTSAIRVYETLKTATGRASSAAASNRFRRFLVVAEIAMAFVLLAGATLLIRGFVRLQKVNAGFEPAGLLTMNVQLPQANYKDAQARVNFWIRLEEAISRIPGVRSASMMDGLPPVRPANQDTTQVEGFVEVANGPIQNVAFYQIVGDRFFETMGTRLLEGRYLEERDGQQNSLGVVVNATMAHTFWPNRSAVGRRLRPGFEGSWYTVVGVVADVKNAGLDKPTDTEAFFPFRQAPWNGSGTNNPNIVVKVAGSPLALAGAVRGAVSSIDPRLPVAKVRTMDDVVAAANSRPRFLTVIVGLFSIVALGLAMVGIYGVVSYSVEQRTAEFGIKIALGAQPSSLLLQVLGQGLWMGILGTIAGVAATALLNRSLETFVFGFRAADNFALALIAGALTLAAIAACCVPAARAMRVEPVNALRYE
jgi:putative ABC transport system permease protein